MAIQYEIKTEHKKWVIEVASLLHNRVAYEEAIKHYIDLTPEEEKIILNRVLLFLIPAKDKANRDGLLKNKRETLMNLFN